jgi:hypothetical protein
MFISMDIVPYGPRYRCPTIVLLFGQLRAKVLTGGQMRLYGLAITIFAAWAMFHALGIDPLALVR